jgi:hypothetical protein
MPPHCDALDGPSIRSARPGPRGTRAREIADRYFYETIVRLHRAGEGAPFTGFMPYDRST